MPHVDPYGHRLSPYQSLLDLANTRLTEQNYRTIVSGGGVGPTHVDVVFPDDPDERIALWDRSHRLAGRPVSRHGVDALQRLLRSNLELDTDGTDPLRMNPLRRFVLFGRRPFEQINGVLVQDWHRDRQGRVIRDSEGRALGRSDPEVRGYDDDLQDFWYVRYVELHTAYKNPPKHLIAPFDRGPRFRLRGLARCGGPHCHQTFFKRTTRSRFCSRRCEYRFHKAHSRHGA